MGYKSITRTTENRMREILFKIKTNGHYKCKNMDEHAISELFTFGIIDNFHGNFINHEREYCLIPGKNFTDANILGPKRFIQKRESKVNPEWNDKILDLIKEYGSSAAIIISMILEFFRNSN